MIQPHHRHNSMSIYLATLTIPDTMLLSSGLILHITRRKVCKIRKYKVDVYVLNRKMTLVILLCTQNKRVELGFAERARRSVTDQVVSEILLNLFYHCHFILSRTVRVATVRYLVMAFCYFSISVTCLYCMVKT